MESNQKSILGIFVILLWFALIGQFYLIIANRQISISLTVIRYFSFFTILTNLIVAVCYTSIVFFPNSGTARFFNTPSNLTAVTVYIMVVGITYQVLLRHVWNPQGFQKLIDELLHSVNPLLAIIAWVVYKPAGIIPFNKLLSWLGYPLIYLTWILVFGFLSDWYPYPFIDVGKLGYSTALLHSFYLLIFFLIIGTLLILLGNKREAARIV
jgi:hypothetical protein